MTQREIQKYINELKDQDFKVRIDAMVALANIGPDAREAVPALIESLKDKHKDFATETGRTILHGAAALALGKIRDPAAVPVLIKALRDEVSLNVIQSLGEIRDPTAVSALTKAFKDKSEAVRKKVVEALGKIGDPTAVPTLTKATKDKDESVRKAAYEALKKLKG